MIEQNGTIRGSIVNNTKFICTFPFSNLHWGGGNASGNKNIVTRNKYIRIISLFCIFIILVTCCVGSVSAFAGGDGSSGNPYQITNATELQSMKDYLDSYFILNNDIDCSGLSRWTPIGTSRYSPYFEGNLNGNNKVIKNLSCSNSNEYFGIFGCVTGGFNLLNCTFDNINFKSSNRYSAIICGYVFITNTLNITYNNVTIKNCKLNQLGDMEHNSLFVGRCEGNTYVGRTTISFTNCSCQNSICIGGRSSSAFASTILDMDGEFKGCSIENCIFNSDTSSGFVISIYNSTCIFDNKCECKNIICKTTSNAYDSSTGGFVGECMSSKVKISENSTKNNGAKISNCLFITIQYKCGGFIGNAGYNGVIDGCSISNCTIISQNTTYGRTGGIIGGGESYSNFNINNPTIKNCVIMGNGNYVGGVVGDWS